MSEAPDSTRDAEQDLALNRQIPPVTVEMKDNVRRVLGDAILSHRKDLNPDNLRPFWANEKPAYALGGLTFDSYDVYSDTPTWENAFNEMLGQLRQLVEGGIIR